MSDFSKQFDGVLKSIRSTINPEYAIPKGMENEAINVRISRIKALLLELNKAKEEVSSVATKLESNLNGLIEEVQPLLDPEGAAEAGHDAKATSEDVGEKDSKEETDTGEGDTSSK